MDEDDHEQTTSYGSSYEARRFRAAVAQTLDSYGMNGYVAAVRAEAKVIIRRFPGKYDAALSQALAYLDRVLIPAYRQAQEE
jgi:hypothetical protein